MGDSLIFFKNHFGHVVINVWSSLKDYDNVLTNYTIFPPTFNLYINNWVQIGFKKSQSPTREIV
jgi:hypothetical protein